MGGGNRRDGGNGGSGWCSVGGKNTGDSGSRADGDGDGGEPDGGATVDESAANDGKKRIAIDAARSCGGGGGGGGGGGSGGGGGGGRGSDGVAGEVQGGGGRDVTRLFRPRGAIELVYRIQKVSRCSM